MPPRWRNRLIDLMLWLVTLGGGALLALGLAAHRLPKPIFWERAFVPASRGWWIGVAGAFLMIAALAIALRRKLAVFAAISAILLAATIFVWMRSHRTTDVVAHLSRPSLARDIPGTYTICWSDSGGICISQVVMRPQSEGVLWWEGTIPTGRDAVICYSSRTASNQYPRQQSPKRPAMDFWERRGFDYSIRPNWGADPPSGALAFTIAVPLWFVTLLLTPGPIVWLGRKLARLRMLSRARKGCCIECGYDLRASPQRCPECGVERVTASR